MITIFILHILRHHYRLTQSAKLIVHFLKLILLITLGNNATTSLEPEFAITANEGTNGDCLIQRAVEAYETDTTAVCTTTVWLNHGDNLHGTNLWSTRESSRRESINKCLNRICALVESSRNTTHKLNDV